MGSHNGTLKARMRRLRPDSFYGRLIHEALAELESQQLTIIGHAAELSRLRGERQVLARLLSEALPELQSCGEYTGDHEKEARLRRLCDQITSALLAVSAGADLQSVAHTTRMGQ